MREGQERVEISPGHYVWMDEKDRKAFAERQKPEPVQAPARPDVENASMVAAERAVMPASQPAKRESESVPEKAPAKARKTSANK